MAETADDRYLEALLEFLRDSRSLDFTGYKRPSLSRRIRKRMDAVGVPTFEEYRDYLEVHPDEHTALVDTILINVTSFFRDAEAWDYLAKEIVPAIVADKPSADPIRIWSAGCATGAEAYSLAMVFADHLGIEPFKSRVKIYATDTDDLALTAGRAGTYTESQLEDVAADKRDRFFERVGPRFTFRPDCRRSVIFGRHDITRDAPISRLDLLVCRNVLMYLVRDAQRHVLSRFHYALGDGGYLFLGKAETIFAHAELFTPSSARHRIFTRASQVVERDQMLSMVPGRIPAAPDPGHQRLSELAAAATPAAQFVVDLDGVLISANTRARGQFGVTQADIGRPFSDLEVSYRPVELRSRIERAYAEARPVVLRDVERSLADGQDQFLEVTVAPLIDPTGAALGVSLVFADVTELGRMTVELERSARELEMTNESLHSTNEELETSNEELQSTNEELETTNEELQSANEELETMNEELQSANEELEAMNEEILDQARQIEASGGFLAGLLNSLGVGVVVVDGKLDVMVWNRAMEDMFGIRQEEADGRSLLALDIGLPVGDLGPLLHELTRADDDETHQTILDAVNRKGQPLRCRVTIDAIKLGDELPDEQRYAVVIDPLPQGL